MNAAEKAMRHKMNCPATTLGHEDDCTCGLKWRDALDTEQAMHAAWRKRAEEAESEIERLRDTMRAIGWQTSDAWAQGRLYEALGEKPSVPQIITETKE